MYCLSVSPPRLLANVAVYPRRFELGDVARGRFVSSSLTLINKGSKTIHVEQVISGCGCTTVKAPKELLPKVPTPFSIVYDSDGPTGKVHKEVKVKFAEFPNDLLIITISGSVHEEIRQSLTDVDLDTIEGGSSQTFAFTATRVDGKPLSVKPVGLPSSVRVAVTNKVSNTASINGILTSPKLPDQYSETLHFRTDDVALPQIAVRLSYGVRPRFIVEPKVADFGAIPPHAKSKMSLTIRGDAPIRLQNVPAGVEANLSEPKSDGGFYTLVVSLAEQGEGKILSERVTLATDDPKQPQIVLPVYAAVRR